MEIATFDWLDYVVFGMMLSISTLIGIYFGCFGNKQKSMNDYLFGGNNMKTVPVALSLVASTISGFSLISIPAEVYTDGATYWLINAAVLFSCLTSYFFILPVLCDLKVATAYEYLELRFNKSVRTIASFYYSMSLLLFMPSVIYVPSLTLSQVTGINLHMITVGITLICVFYTMIGGLKAVVWTDFLQITIMIIACFAIAIIGTIDAGGFNHVMKTVYDDGVLNIFKMDPSPFIRTTFWTMTAGAYPATFATIAIAQSTIQRFLSLPDQKAVKRTMIIFYIGFLIIISLCIYSGILAYVSYYGCDPVKNEIISKTDQIFPYYIIDKVGYVPVLPGLYVAGVFSAALSTLSTGLNTLAGVFYEDYFKKKIGKNENAHLYMKLIVIIMGIFCIGMVFIVENMGKILSLTIMITSITNAPLVALFVLGMMIPIANTKGAIASVITSTIAVSWIVIGSTLSKVNLKVNNIYPDGINTCPNNNTNLIEIMELNTTQSIPIEDDVFILYKLSFMHYVIFGLIIGLFFGVITSYITGPTDTMLINPALISPPLRIFLPKKPPQEQIQSEEKLMLDKL